MIKLSSLERGIISGAEGLAGAALVLLLSCSPSSSPSSPSSQPQKNTYYSNQPQSQPRQTQTPVRSSTYEHPNFAYVAANPDNFSGHNIELTGYWVETSSGALRLGYGIGSKRVRTDMRTNESPLANKYNDIICSPSLSSMDPNSGKYTTTLRGTIQNGRLRVHSGHITGPDGTVYKF